MTTSASDHILCVNNIHYDYKTDKINVWETIEKPNNKFKVVKKTVDVEYFYYSKDRSGKSNIKDIYGNPMIRNVAKNRQSYDNIKGSGSNYCETDIPHDWKYLHENYEKANLKPKIEYFNTCFIDIELESGTSFSKSDIDNTVYPINLISFKSSKTGEIFIFGKEDYPGLNNYHFIPDEKRLLEKFIECFRKQKFHIITGWNVYFDINYILNRARKLGIEDYLSPINVEYKNKKSGDWSIGGISILDYMAFFKDMKFHQERMPSYSLQAVCVEESKHDVKNNFPKLKQGKIQFEGTINNFYKTDWKKFVEYNIQDVELVEELDRKNKFLELAVIISHSALIPLEKVFSAIAVVEGQLITFLHSENKVAPDKKITKETASLNEKFEGGYVEANIGYYRNVASWDFESLYPTIIFHSNISPETLVLHPQDPTNLISTVLSNSDGIYYKREIGFLPKVVKTNFDQRKQFKDLKKKYEAEGNKELEKFYDDQQKIKKVFLLCFFGAVGNPYCRFFNINLARTITMGGQHLIQYVRDQINNYFNNHFYKNPKFYDVIDEKNKTNDKYMVLCDTDSYFFDIGKIKDRLGNKDDLLTWVNDFDQKLMKNFFKIILDDYFTKNYGVKNEMNFKLEKIIDQMVVFGKKNYAVSTLSNEGIVYNPPKFSVTGFASKRSDRPFFCKKKIDEIVKLFFANKDLGVMSEALRLIEKDFNIQKIEDVSRPMGVTDYRKYARTFEDYSENGLRYYPHTPMHNRAAIVYNYIIQTEKLPYELIDSGAKIKYIAVYPNNKYMTDIVGFIGNYPKEFESIFKIDYKRQLQDTFLNSIQILYDSIGWGLINLEYEDEEFIS